MKTNKHIIIFAGAALAALAACNKQDPAKPDTPAAPGTLVAYSDEQAKTYLQPSGDEFQMLWNGTDQIATIQNGNVSTYAIPKEEQEKTEGKQSANFQHVNGKGPGLSQGSFYAIYPQSIVSTDNGPVISWPADQSNTRTDAGGPMYAAAEADDKGGAKLHFTNLGGALRLKVNVASDIDDFSVGSIVISADQPLSGKVNISAGSDGKYFATIDPSVKAGEVEMTFGTGKKISTSSATPDLFYFSLPAGIYTGVRIMFIGTDGKVIAAALKPGKTLEIQRNIVTLLSLADAAPSDINSGANCFIGEGNVPIRILAMGQVPGTYTTDNGYCTAWQSLFTGGVQGCKIVWQTVNTATKPADGTVIKSASYANGVLTVIPTGTPGNALVAVTKKNAQAQDEIVWSYHIWVPETSISTKSINGVTLMDRNLGALTETGVTALGMQYQWGRKDPLLGFCTFDNIEKYVMNGVIYNETNLPSTYYTTTKGLTSSIQNPDKWIRASQSNWCEGNVCKFWGCGQASSVTAEEEILSKTIYDPCPSGYRVASKKDFRTAFGSEKASLADNLFTISGIIFPKVAKMHHGGSDSYYETRKGHGVTTATVYSDAVHQWNMGLEDKAVIKFGSTSDGDYGAESYNVRCVRDNTAAGEGYSFNVIGYESIDFFGE